MKKTLGFLITSAALTGGVFAQQLSAGKVPASVRESCQSKFEGVRKVEWKLKSDQTYEAEFKLNGVEIAAKFDSTGKWLETETTLEQSKLTREVRATISKEYKGYRIIETQKVEHFDDKRILFEVHLENAKEILKLQFEGNGTLFSKSAKRKKDV
jgi:hypothetical protein